MERRFSLFGPLFLIAAGVMWLMIQQGIVPVSNLWALTFLWPFLLITAGLSLILRSYWKYASVVLDVLLIGGAFAAVFFAGQLGWTNAPSYMFNVRQFGGPGQPGSGNVITAMRDVNDFQGITVDYPAEIVIRQGTTESLMIEAEDNVVKDIRTDVKNGTLTIERQSDHALWVNPSKPVKITILVKDLTQLNFNSAGTLTVESLKSDSFNLNLEGAGTMTLDNVQFKIFNSHLDGAGALNMSGVADNMDVNMSGFGSFKAADLKSQTAKVNISGAGSATVWVESSLAAEISGAGSISYYGNPTVSKSVDGLGSVNRLGNK